MSASMHDGIEVPATAPDSSDTVFGPLFRSLCLYRAVVCGIIVVFLSSLAAIGVTRHNAWYILAILLAEIGLSLGYALLRARLPGADSAWYRATLGVDVIAVTTCIHFLGPRDTPYGLAVYAFFVVYAAAGVSLRESVRTAAACIVAYAALHALRAGGVLPIPASAFAAVGGHQEFLVSVSFLVLFLVAMVVTAGDLASTIREEQQARRVAQRELEELNAELEGRVQARTAALRESEERFRQLAENIEDIIWLLGDDLTNFAYVSPAYERITGRSAAAVRADPTDAMRGVHPDDRERVRECFAAGAWDGTFDAEYRIVRPDGAVRWIRTRAFPIRDEQGKPYRIVGISEHTTARREAEERARHHQAELAHVLRVSTMGEMASGLAHELQQPIAAVVSAAKACVRRLEAGNAEYVQLEEMMNEAATQALRAGEIVEHLRAFLEKRERRRENVDVNAVIRDVASLVDHEARQGGVVVRLDLESSIPPVHADRVQLEQVIVNVVRNGIEATREVEHSVGELRIETSLTDTNVVAIAICDNGVGLASDVADHMFDPFFTTRHDGLGMGLAISRSILEAHGGVIAATANPGAGTTVRLTVPLAGVEVRHAV